MSWRAALDARALIEIAREREAYFVPEGTALNVQLSQFQRNRRRLAFVVNEYGDIEGLVTLEDILEEIVGEFTTDPATITHKDVHLERPGVYIVNASATIRALNRALQWQLPTEGPKTLNGLLLEQLETIPDSRHDGESRSLRVRGAADCGKRDQDGAGAHRRRRLRTCRRHGRQSAASSASPTG